MNPRYPNRFQSRTIWRAITGLAILIIGLLIAGLIWLIGETLGYLQPVLVPLAVAGIVAYLLDPFVSWLQKKGLSRLKAVISVFASFIVFLVLLGFVIVPPIAKQISDALHDKEEIARKATAAMTGIKDAPWLKPVIDYASEKVNPETGATHIEVEPSDSAPTPSATPQGADSDIQTETEYGEADYQYRWQYLISKYAGQIVKTITDWFSEGSSKILGMLGLMLGFVMTPIYLYYFLKESSGIKAHWHEYVPLKASKFKTEVVDTLQEINGYLISFFRGQMLVAFIDGLLVGIALFAFGLPYALVIGLTLAFLGVIPFIGNILCMIPACIIAYVHGATEPWGIPQWWYVGGVVAIFFTVQQINSLLTAPKIVGDSVGLHPMTVIFSMLFWSLLLGGFIGALLAVPLTAAVKVLFRRYIWERKINEPPQPLDHEQNDGLLDTGPDTDPAAG